MSTPKKEEELKNIAGYLAKVFLNNPITMVIIVSIFLLGYISLKVMPREEDPQIQVSGGSVIVVMPGANVQEIENVIIEPLERKIREIKGVEHIYSTAMNNVGMLNVQYYIGENREDSNLKLYDKVMQNMDKMPQTAFAPLIKPFDIDIDVPILTLAFYKKKGCKLSNTEFYDTIKDLQQDINARENVAKTTLKGIKKPQYNIQVDLDKLSGYHISFGQIAAAIKSISTNAPDIDTPSPDGTLTVFGIQNAIDSVEDLQNLIIASYRGSPIYLKDIATVSCSYNIQDPQSSLIYFKDKGKKKDKEQVTMTVSKLKGTNAVVIVKDVLKFLHTQDRMLQNLKIGYIVTRDYGKRADEAVNELMHHLIITIFIISAILVPVLGWREALVVTIAVPMILATTLFIAYLTGQTINRITLFAFLLSLGLIVDDAIIVIENIHRRMHLKECQDQKFDDLIVLATDEIGPSTNIATIAIMLTMIPMAFVGGMMGQFMLPIPLNVPVGLAVSLFVAYVFTPYLAKKLIKRATHHGHDDLDNDIDKIVVKKSLLRSLLSPIFDFIKKVLDSIKKESASWKS